ncbi:MAG: coniferyl aldehyde dehydrogenase [Kangiellaceae bacterium]|nr:coniferyl aldehyde dehydrogenase [Kangiellaceae bacterium]
MNHSPSLHDITEQLTSLKNAFLENPYPAEKLRKQQLIALKFSLLKHKNKLVKAVSADFGSRSEDETLLADIMPTVMAIEHAIKHLSSWMKTEKRKVAMLFQPISNRIIYQPLGVIGIMSPWNYPIYLSLGPLVAAIAAGNKAIIKPSEFTPYTNRIINDIVSEAFTSDEVALVEGDAEMAAHFSGLPFDHLIFTGSTAVGKKVMAAAAQNLTPVTLELGGKSPAIIGEDVTAEFAVERMMYGKCVNAGQTCVAPDYVLCPENKVSELKDEFQRQFSQLYPDLNCGDYSSIINSEQYTRLKTWLQDAVDKGATKFSMANNIDQESRLMPLTLLLNVNDSMQVMQQEIFGPLLPIVPYRNLQEAIKYVQDRPRPLALYVYTHNKGIEDDILKRTHSGGVCINDAATHVIQEDLPFGGVGPSGMGHYHAKEGFHTFSSVKPVLRRGKFNSAKLALPPYGKFIHKFIYNYLLK